MASRCLVASPLPRFLFDLMLVAMGFVGNIVEAISARFQPSLASNKQENKETHVQSV